MGMLDWLVPVLGILLVALGVTNAVLMAEVLGRRKESPTRRGVHRWIGRIFVIGVLAFFVYMFPRAAGFDKFPPHAALHAALGSALVPLVLGKLLVGRRYKAFTGALPVMGFTLLVSVWIVIMLTSGGWLAGTLFK